MCNGRDLGNCGDLKDLQLRILRIVGIEEFAITEILGIVGIFRIGNCGDFEICWDFQLKECY